MTASVFALMVFTFFWSTPLKAQYDFGFLLDTDLQYPSQAQSEELSHQSIFTLEQNWSSKDRKQKAVLQVRTVQNTVFFEGSELQHSDIYPADFYIESRHGAHRFSIGYQHLFLVEGFDSISMELINPKNDNLSYFLSADKKYLTAPLVQHRWTSDLISTQIFASLQHRSDVAFSYIENQVQNAAPGFTYDRLSGSERFKKNDIGVRLQSSLGSFDFNLGILRTFDKSNQITIDPAGFRIEQMADPFTSQVFGFSGDISGIVVRADYQRNSKRKTTLADLSYMPLDYQNLNFGVEASLPGNLQVALNYSKSEIVTKTNLKPLFREQVIEDIYVRGSKKLSDEQDIEVFLLRRLSDQGFATQFNYLQAMSSQFGLKFGFELFTGKRDSQFSAVNDLSRIYTGISATVF